MAFTEGSQDGALNGTTPVDLVSSPSGSNRRIVRNVIVHNRDTAAVTLIVRFVDGANTRQIDKVTLQPLDTYNLGVVVLDSTSKSITGLLTGAPATTNPDFVSTYGDAS